MIKTTIKLSITIVAIVAIFSCSKESITTIGKGQISIISANIVQPSEEGATKTSLGPINESQYPILWKNGDAISISNQHAATSEIYTTTSDATQSGIFTSDATAPEDPVFAYYPASNVANVNNSIYTVTIPATQSYVEDSFDNGAFPMYASADILENGLEFSPLMSVLKLQLTSTDAKTVKKILLTSETENLCGIAQVDMSTGIITWKNGKKSIELDCGEGVALTSSVKTFHIVVPPAESKNYCVVIETTDSGKGIGKRLSSKTFSVGRIKKMPEVSVTNETATKPIYAEGAYMGEAVTFGTMTWAPVNCGYDASHTYGLLYQWGRRIGGGYDLTEGMLTAISSTYDENGQNTNPEDSYFYKGESSPYDWYTTDKNKQLASWPMKSSDSGYVAWKIDNPCPAGWRVPTYDELNTLKTYSSLTTNTVGGVAQTGRWFYAGSYTYDASVPQIFLPAAGRLYYGSGSASGRETSGFYWSSSVTSNNGRCMSFTSSSVSVGNGARARSYSVRCVQE